VHSGSGLRNINTDVSRKEQAFMFLTITTSTVQYNN